MEQKNDSARTIGDRVASLTDRQRECMLLVAEGQTSKQIARALGISPSTVDNHIRTAVVVLGSANRVEAARTVIEWVASFESQQGSGSNVKRRAVSNERPRRPDPIRFTRLPPIGGKTNTTSNLQRLVHIAQVALLGTMLFAAITATIAGLVNLFAR